MKLQLLTIGKCKEKHINELIADYQKRLKPHWPLTLTELPHGKGDVSTIKATEAKTLLAKIPEQAFVIALDERGKQLTTTALAQKLSQIQDSSTRDLCLIIGGAEGLDETVRQKADFIWSLSPLTFPHMLVRVILAEQLYRAATILAGHPYHRE